MTDAHRSINWPEPFSDPANKDYWPDASKADRRRIARDDLLIGLAMAERFGLPMDGPAAEWIGRLAAIAGVTSDRVLSALRADLADMAATEGDPRRPYVFRWGQYGAEPQWFEFVGPFADKGQATAWCHDPGNQSGDDSVVMMLLDGTLDCPPPQLRPHPRSLTGGGA